MARLCKPFLERATSRVWPQGHQEALPTGEAPQATAGGYHPLGPQAGVGDELSFLGWGCVTSRGPCGHGLPRQLETPPPVSSVESWPGEPPRLHEMLMALPGTGVGGGVRGSHPRAWGVQTGWAASAQSKGGQGLREKDPGCWGACEHVCPQSQHPKALRPRPGCVGAATPSALATDLGPGW